MSRLKCCDSSWPPTPTLSLPHFALFSLFCAHRDRHYSSSTNVHTNGSKTSGTMGCVEVLPSAAIWSGLLAKSITKSTNVPNTRHISMTAKHTSGTRPEKAWLQKCYFSGHPYLCQTKDSVDPWSSLKTLNRHQEVVLRRLCIGLCWFSHAYLISNDVAKSESRSRMPCFHVLSTIGAMRALTWRLTRHLLQFSTYVLSVNFFVPLIFFLLFKPLLYYLSLLTTIFC